MLRLERRKKKNTHNQIRSGRFSQRRVPCCGTFVICTKEQAPPVTGSTPPEQHPTYDTPAAIVTVPPPQRLLRKVGDTTQTKRPSPITCRPSGLPPVTLFFVRRDKRGELLAAAVVLLNTSYVLHRDQSIIHTLIPCAWYTICLLYTSPSPRDLSTSRMPSSA